MPVSWIRLGACALWLAAPGWAAAKKPAMPKLGDLATDLREIEANVVAAERAAAKERGLDDAKLAKRLVAGELRLAQGDAEGAAILFLDLINNYGDSAAGIQAVVDLGEALLALDMPEWARDSFLKNLNDERAEARRLHQRSLAHLFDLAAPRQAQGFARRPGLAATPEARARIQSVGGTIDRGPPKGVVDGAMMADLERRFLLVPAQQRLPELRFAFGRWAFLSGQHDRAVVELDSLAPLGIPKERQGVELAWRVRAGYVAAAAVLARGDDDDALKRFAGLAKLSPTSERDRAIVELAWMALARIHHDRGATGKAVRAYRRIGRDSGFFLESLYETAWTLLRGGRYEQAIQALDLLLIYEPKSPIVAEIKQLRGKIRVQQRQYKLAEEEFLALRREFDKLAKGLGRKLQARAGAAEYFAAVVAEDMEHFSLDALFPVAAVSVARSLPRAAQAENVAQEIGRLQRDLVETRALLARMEEAVQARDKARLFTDLAAHAASLDYVEVALLRVEEHLVARVGPGAEDPTTARQAALLKRRVDQPLTRDGDTRGQALDRLSELAEHTHKLELTVASMRAELIASERYYEDTRAAQKIDRQAFLKEAAALRDMIASHEGQVAALREQIAAVQAVLRYDDPSDAARRQAQDQLHVFLSQAYAAGTKARSSPDAATLWRRAENLFRRSAEAREALEQAARGRLEGAIEILGQERANLDGYLSEFTTMQADGRGLLARVLSAALDDVVTELADLVLRSEVGLLDVAWAMKDAQTEEIDRLERRRDRDLADLERALELGLEDAQ